VNASAGSVAFFVQATVQANRSTFFVTGSRWHLTFRSYLTVVVTRPSGVRVD